jgi:hypothetical protein
MGLGDDRRRRGGPVAIRSDQRAGKYDLLIIDHLHRIRIKDRKHGREELEENVRRITNISKEFNIPVLLLAQLSREEKRNPFPPHTRVTEGQRGDRAGGFARLVRVAQVRRLSPADRRGRMDHRQEPLWRGRFKNLHFRASQVRFTEVQRVRIKLVFFLHQIPKTAKPKGSHVVPVEGLPLAAGPVGRRVAEEEMTGRRLYDLFCDAWAGQAEWCRESSTNELGLSSAPVAWPFLSGYEQSTFNRAATRIRGRKR